MTLITQRYFRRALKDCVPARRYKAARRVPLDVIVAANRFHVNDGYESEFVERFSRSRAGLADQPGFVRFELLQPANDSTATHVAKTYWESVDDFEAWTESDAFADAHGGDGPPEGMFDGHPDLEIHEVAFEETPE
jgi:heme-degrading monooxygenase HmoA